MSTSTSDPDRVTHPLDVGYLVTGLVFLGVAGSWALRAAGVVDTHQVGWLIPLVLVGAGTVGLVALAGRSLSRTPAARDTATDTDDWTDTREA
jgi:hypothetical protein